MNLSNELQTEIGRWSKRLEERLLKVEPTNDIGRNMLENIRAYQRDAGHFLEKDNLVKSFECLIWAWAFLEIGVQLNHLHERCE